MRRSGDGDPIAAPPRRRRREPRRRPRIGWLWPVLLLAFPIGALVGYFSSSDPPAAALSTDLLDFGEVRLGAASAQQVVRVSNRGEQALWINAASLEGDAAGDFRVVADDCAGLEVPAAAECSVRLVFEPAVRGARRARVRLDGNAVGGPRAVPLIGVGVAPELAVEPGELDLGRQAVGGVGEPATLRLTNRGTAALRLGRIRLEGRHAEDFRRVADDCGQRLLEPGERCSVSVVLTPTRAGARQAAIWIESDAAAEPARVSLIGRAWVQEPVLRLDPQRVDFGSSRVGEATDARAVTLANDGNGPLRLRAVRLKRPDLGFEVSAAPCSGAELQPGGGCRLEVSFRPRAEGAVATVLEVDSNAPRSPHRLALAGTGTVPRASVEPSRLSFGEVDVGTTSEARAVRLGSSGSDALRIAGVAVSGADADAFSARGCSGAVVAPGEACRVEVRFRPRRAGPHRAELLLRHDASGGSVQLPLNGLGVAAGLSLDPSRLDFGEVRTGEAARRRLTLRSSGRADLEIRRLRLTGGRDTGFEIDDDRCSGATLEPAETCTVTVLFRPASAGTRSTQLAIEHSAGDRPREVPMTATAVGVPP